VQSGTSQQGKGLLSRCASDFGKQSHKKKKASSSGSGSRARQRAGCTGLPKWASRCKLPQRPENRGERFGLERAQSWR
jgi:hypothetical protein